MTNTTGIPAEECQRSIVGQFSNCKVQHCLGQNCHCNPQYSNAKENLEKLICHYCFIGLKVDCCMSVPGFGKWFLVLGGYNQLSSMNVKTNKTAPIENF